jgi:ribonuclease HII
MPRKPAKELQRFMFDDSTILELGIDEAGRGPLFGRVYAAAVILPKDDRFPHELMKDSKKFTNHKKLDEAANIIMEKAIAYSVKYAENTEIDMLNPLKATMKIMNDCVSEIIDKMSNKDEHEYEYEYKPPNFHLLVDGSYFRPRVRLDKNGKSMSIPYTCVTSGDDTYTSIAAASILAKHHRDAYIDSICEKYEGLNELYDLKKNKGYGTSKHLDAIKKYGITKWHRKTFGICKEAKIIEIEIMDE